MIDVLQGMMCSRTPIYSESVAMHNVQTCAAGHDARVHISIHYMCAGHNARTLPIQAGLKYVLRIKSSLLMFRYVMLPYVVLFSATIYGGEQIYDSTNIDEFCPACPRIGQRANI